MRHWIAAALAATSLAALADAPAGDPARGKGLFMKNMCYTCHGTAGQGGDRGAGPRLAPHPFPWDGFVKQVRHPRAAMPHYPAQFVSDADLADIYAYIASIQPGRAASDIALLRE